MIKYYVGSFTALIVAYILCSFIPGPGFFNWFISMMLLVIYLEICEHIKG